MKRLLGFLLFITTIAFGQSSLFFANEPSATSLAWFAQTSNGAVVYHDYAGQMSTPIGVAIGADQGILDVTGNNVDGTAINGTMGSNFLHQSFYKPIPGFLDNDNDALSLGQPTALRDGFRAPLQEWHILFAATDGQIGASYNLFGVLNSAAGYANLYVDANGRINVGYAINTGSNAVNWQSTAGVIVNGSTGLLHARVQLNFTTDVISIWLNGAVVSGSITAGNLSTVDPSLWSSAQNFYVGALNNAGTITTNSNAITFMRFAITTAVPPSDALTAFNSYFKDDLWKSQFRVTAANATAKRTALTTAIFGGALPSNATPASTASVTTGLIHGWSVTTDITGWASITRLRFNRDGCSNYVYRIVNPVPNNKLILYVMGHSPINDKLAVNNFLSLGYDVLLTAMADTGDVEDLSDNTASGTWTPVSGGNHNEMSVLNVAGLQYFLYDKIEAVNYCVANFSYTSYYVTGISGGGWTTLYLAALDVRFTKAFPIRGWKGRIYKCYPNPTLSDFEQGGSNGSTLGSGQAVYDFKTTYTDEDIAALGTTGGRLVYTITHVDDTALLGGNEMNTFKEQLQNLATALGGAYNSFINTNPLEPTHLIYQDELNVINANL